MVYRAFSRVFGDRPPLRPAAVGSRSGGLFFPRVRAFLATDPRFGPQPPYQGPHLWHPPAIAVFGPLFGGLVWRSRVFHAFFTRFARLGPRVGFSGPLFGGLVWCIARFSRVFGDRPPLRPAAGGSRSGGLFFPRVRAFLGTDPRFGAQPPYQGPHFWHPPGVAVFGPHFGGLVWRFARFSRVFRAFRVPGSLLDPPFGVLVW